MKVNISYSVVLEEVLPVVHKLYKETKKEFDSTFTKSVATIGSSFTDDELQILLLNIKTTRTAMLNFDSKLEECLNMLVGYQKIINGEEVTSPLQPSSTEKISDEPA